MMDHGIAVGSTSTGHDASQLLSPKDTVAPKEGETVSRDYWTPTA